MLFLGAWGKVINEKNLKQKISWHCPFKGQKYILFTIFFLHVFFLLSSWNWFGHEDRI